MIEVCEGKMKPQKFPEGSILVKSKIHSKRLTFERDFHKLNNKLKFLSTPGLSPRHNFAVDVVGKLAVKFCMVVNQLFSPARSFKEL